MWIDHIRLRASRPNRSSVTRVVLVLSVRDALGSRWTANWTGWLILFIPSTFVVVLQEFQTPFPWWGLMILSAIAQHISNIIVAFVIASPFRRVRPVVPLGAAVAIWLAIGISRGVVGGLFAEVFAGIPGDFAYRIGYWVMVSVIWVPLFVYSMAQFDRRRELLGMLGEATAARDAARERHNETAAQLRERLLSTIQLAIAPVIAEIRLSLESLSPTMAARSMEEIGDRLTLVAGEAGRIIDEAGPPVTATKSEGRRSIIEAATFDQDRPVLVPALTGLTVMPLVLPDAIRFEGLLGALGDVAAIGVGIVVLSLGLAVLRATGRGMRPGTRLIVVAAVSVLAGLLAAAALVYLESPLPRHDIVFAIVLPFGFAFGAAVNLIAVGVAFSNQTLWTTITELHNEVTRLYTRSRRSERRARDQVASLMHGPVQGRLAACAMALNFHTAEGEPADPERTAAITQQVLAHLSAASADLEVLARGGTQVTPRRPRMTHGH